MSYRLTPSEIAADRATLQAIESLGTYQSVNPAYSIEALRQIDAALRAAQDATEQARRIYEQGRQAYEQARDTEYATAKMLHDLILMAKAQVKVQYGADSYAVKAIGWTRRSDRKRPARKASAG
ncbi:hypothetical protein K2Z83_21260 [Oscillochloris sp. ZM17-4]|uniref:hypothetical protein n=1 Tax=Oscillochloris sp. ZM17-4 TaxID=2866714 RepID=UPI001C731F73|nr:hypothetical protein [Oscillochloris sp. ZM17-4]MBX0330202.1 hypothetical protein [Oscillochloris sp. ZM17-4]